MQEKEKAELIIDRIDANGIFERTNEKELFQVTKVNDHKYNVKIVDSDVTQDNHKNYSHDREGLKEFLIAHLSNPSSILHRL